MNEIALYMLSVSLATTTNYLYSIGFDLFPLPWDCIIIMQHYNISYWWEIMKMYLIRCQSCQSATSEHDWAWLPISNLVISSKMCFQKDWLVLFPGGKLFPAATSSSPAAPLNITVCHSALKDFFLTFIFFLLSRCKNTTAKQIVLGENYMSYDHVLTLALKINVQIGYIILSDRKILTSFKWFRIYLSKINTPVGILSVLHLCVLNGYFSSGSP